MGPASENAGYAVVWSAPSWETNVLQWVQRPRTLVMPNSRVADHGGEELQWVQRPRTLVMVVQGKLPTAVLPCASMGPASENAGYDLPALPRWDVYGWLQ